MSFTSVVNALRPGYAGHTCEIRRHGQKPKRFWIQPRDPVGRWTDKGARASSSSPRAPRTAAKKAKPTSLQEELKRWQASLERGLINILMWYVVFPGVLCLALYGATIYTGYIDNYAARYVVTQEVAQARMNGLASFAAPAPRVKKPILKKKAPVVKNAKKKKL